MIKSILLLCAGLIQATALSAPQDTPSGKPYEKVALQLITDGLGSGQAYRMLAELTGTVGARLSGSPQADRAIEWGRRTMTELDFDSVWLEKLMVPRWVRGPIEEAYVEPSSGGRPIPLSVCALGGVGPGGPSAPKWG